MKPPKERFTEIYQKNRWGVGSGEGSDPIYSSDYLDFLNDLKREYTRFLDLGCGDWQLYQGFNWGASVYLGVDVFISDDLLKNSRENVTFKECDITNSSELSSLISDFNPDVILVKDVMQHMSDEELKSLCATLRLSDWQILVAVNDHRYVRSPEKNSLPRDIENKYSWAPINSLGEDIVSLGLQPYIYYPRNKRKCVLVAERESEGNVI
jgi:succinate dehydrogenase flavin-adding protein (antitoxin of CptAB toxin-antitoxin module)